MNANVKLDAEVEALRNALRQADEIDHEFVVAILGQGADARALLDEVFERLTVEAYERSHKRIGAALGVTREDLAGRWRAVLKARRDAIADDPNKTTAALVNRFLDESGLRGGLWYVNGAWALWDADAGCYARVEDVARPTRVLRIARVWLSGNGFDKWGFRKVREFLALVALEVTLPDGFVGWLDRRDGEWLACSNGLVNVLDGDVVPLSCDYVGFNNTGYAFDPDAQCPVWLAFLNDVFEGDAESIRMSKLFFGLTLVGWREIEMVMLLLGRTRGGKGTWIRALQGMLGSGYVEVTLKLLGNDHGESALVGKRVAFVSEMRASARNGSEGLNRIISISGGDNIVVNRKHDPDVHSIPGDVRFVLAANEPPFTSETSGALMARLKLLAFTRSYVGREDTTLTPRIRAERSGLLNWAIEGVRALQDGARIVTPARARGDIENFADATNPVLAFMRHECKAGGYITKDAFRAVLGAWMSINAGDSRVPHMARLTGVVRDAAAQLWRVPVTPGQKRISGRVHEVYYGVQLNGAMPVEQRKDLVG